MNKFRDPDFLDRLGTVIAGVAGVAGTASGGVAVGGALLAAALAGKAALQGRLDAKSSDASHVIGEFIEQFKDNWDVWSELKSRPEDLHSAAQSFEDYFRGGDSRSIPTAELIIAEGLDAEKIARVMLVTASKHSPNVYSDTPINVINRLFFTNVIQSAISHLIKTPAFVDTLQPVFQKIVIESLSDIKEGLGELHNKFDEQVEASQTKEQYENQLHTMALDLRQKETELRLLVSELERSESRTAEEQKKYIEAKIDLVIVGRERDALNIKLADVDASYKATKKALTQALSKIPENRLKQAREKLVEGPMALADEISFIVEEESAPLAAAGYEAANLYEDQLQYSKALKQYRKASVLDDGNPMFLSSHARLAHRLGFHAEAETLYVNALAIYKSQFGEEDLRVALALLNLANVYLSQGKYVNSKSLISNALGIQKAQGESSTDYARSLNILAGCFKEQGDYKEAESLLREAIEVSNKLRRNNPELFLYQHNLATVLDIQGESSEAEELLLETLSGCGNQLKKDYSLIIRCYNSLASIYKSQRRYNDAEKLYTGVLDIEKNLLGNDHSSVAIILSNLATVNRYQGRHDNAELLFNNAIEMLVDQLGEDHPDTLTCQNNLAVMFHDLQRYQEAEDMFTKIIELQKNRLGEDHPDVAMSICNLAGVFLDQDCYSDAEPLYLQGIRVFEKILGTEHPSTKQAKLSYEYLLEHKNNDKGG